MANLTINSTDHKFHYPTSGKGTVNLGTANTFLDRDIVIEDPAAVVGSENVPTNTISVYASLGPGLSVPQSPTDYYVTASASSTWEANKKITTGGYIAKDTAISVSGSSSDNSPYVYIPTNSITGSVDRLDNPSIVLSPGISGMATSSTATAYSVTPTGTVTKGSVYGKATAGGTTGIVAKNTTNTSSKSEIDVAKSGETATYIQAAAVTLSGSANSASPTISTATADSTAKGTAVSITPSTTIPSDTSKYYIPIKASVAKTDITPTKTVTEGYLKTNAQITGSVSANAKTGSTYYLPMAGSTMKNSSGTAVTQVTPGLSDQAITISAGYYSSNRTLTVKSMSNGTSATYANVASLPSGASAWADTPIITSGGYLHITAGYTPERYLPLSKLVPDVATITTSTSNKLLTGESAYDKDGTLITGSMPSQTNSSLSLSLGKKATSQNAHISPNINGDDILDSYTLTGYISATAGTKAPGYYPMGLSKTVDASISYSLPASYMQGGLVPNTDTTNYPTGYRWYKVYPSEGWSDGTGNEYSTNINVYQGAYTTT